MKNLLILLLLSICAPSCTSQTKKINAVSFVASSNAATQKNISHIKQINVNFAAVMPFGFIKSQDTPHIVHNTDNQWFGETVLGAKQYTNLLHENNIAVMIKPQLWIWGGAFTGKLEMSSQEDWIALEHSYRDFIMTYATLAQEMNAALFCIGTELEQFVVNRPQYWSKLITEIKQVYKGKLTYAANWDEYKRISFWETLDFIGVDGYFPICDAKTPTVAQARLGWQSWKKELASVSKTYKTPILFTEYGYRSVDFSGKEPWRSDVSMPGVNLQGQVNLTQALYQELYPESWFAGGFIWKWFLDDAHSGGLQNKMFTPQNKPVEQLIKNHFSKYN